MIADEAERYERSLARIIALMVLISDVEYLGEDELLDGYEERLQEAITERDEASAKIVELGGSVIDGQVILPKN